MEYCYAVCFTNGVVKFGRTSDLHARLSAHVSSAVNHGVMCLCALVSGSLDSKDDERKMLAAATSRLTKNDGGHEYFSGTPNDAMGVMLFAGLLPIASYPTKDGRSIKFSIASVGFDFSSVRMIKSNTGRCVRQSILRVLKKGKLSHGVLCNRVRSFDVREVTEGLQNLTQTGEVKRTERLHAGNQNVVYDYELTTFPVDTPSTPC